MMAEPVLHPQTRAQFKTMQAAPSHAVLIAGPLGMGKATVARWYAAQLLAHPADKLTTHPYYQELGSSDGKAIGIEAIRQLERFVTLKTSGSTAVNRVVFIDDAHLLTAEAQNALLKTLEEPPEGTVLLLASPRKQALLPTIQSRLQTVDIIKPGSEALTEALPKQNAQLLALSGGLPGLSFALAQDDAAHPLVAAATTARQMLQQSTFERLCYVEKLSKDKEASRNLVYMLMHMARAALLTGKSGARWQKVLRAAHDTDSALAQGTQPKLALTNLMLNL